jgi:hypothetical protein
LAGCASELSACANRRLVSGLLRAVTRKRGLSLIPFLPQTPQPALAVLALSEFAKGEQYLPSGRLCGARAAASMSHCDGEALATERNAAGGISASCFFSARAGCFSILRRFSFT